MDSKYWKNENWWVSQFNYEPEVRNELKSMPEKVKFHDVTLRDGEQAPGVVFRKEDKIRIASLLSELGVSRIEVALPAVSEEDVQAVKAVVAMKLNPEIFVLSRGMESDINLALECGVDGIILELPLGRPRLQYQFPNWTDAQVINQTVHCIKYAKEKGLKIVLFPMDCSRADPALFYEFLKTVAAQEAKPDAITLVDTTGCLIPQAAAFMTCKIKEITGLPVEVHSHSDLGLGVSTSLAAVAAGAEVVHASLAGLGERTGNTPLEEVAVALQTVLGIDVGLDFSKLTAIVRETAKIAGFALAPNKPIVGERAFTRESGMGLELVREAPLALFCLNPIFVGQQAQYVLGKKSGIASIEMKYADLGLGELSDEKKKDLLNKVKAFSIEKKGLVTDQEFMDLIGSES